MTIDSHHHFWKYGIEEYGWIDDTMKVIRRDFLPADLKKEIQAAGIDGVVSVQARQTLEENRFLLDFARRNDFIKGVVGWVPLIDPNVRGALEEFAQQPKAKGVRHVLQGEPDDRYILREDFNRGIALLKDLGLVYDILIFERHLPQTLQFVDRHPDQVFVLDHIAKPRIKDGYLSPWQTNIVQLAHRPNVYCKISGMVTEADYQNWTEEELTPYIDTVVSAFGPKRVMFGSDWPVCLVACPYGRWVEIVKRRIAELSETEQRRILGETAVEAYKL
jgi:L-fuconolactonase